MKRLQRAFLIASISLSALMLYVAAFGDVIFKDGFENPPFSGHLLSRDEAIARAREEVVDGWAADRFVLALMPQEPLPAGTDIFQLGVENGTEPVATTEAPSFLVFLDLVPTHKYGHPVRYLLVNAETGAVTEHLAYFPPSAGGTDLYLTFENRLSSPDRFEPVTETETLKPVIPIAVEYESEAPPGGSLQTTTVRSFKSPVELDGSTQIYPVGRKVVVTVASGTGAIQQDATDMGGKLRDEYGFEWVEVNSADDDLATAIQKIREAAQGLGPDDKFMLYISSHTYLVDRNKDGVPDRLPRDLAYDYGGANETEWRMFDADDEEHLTKIIEDITAGIINLVVDGCFAESVIEWMRRPVRSSFDPKDNVTINVFVSSTKEKTSSITRGRSTIEEFLASTPDNSAYTGQVLDNLPTAVELDKNGDNIIQIPEFEAGIMSAHNAAGEALAGAQMPPPVATFYGHAVKIDLPLGGGVVKLGATVVFQGRGTGPNTGSLVPGALSWDSDIDGFLGTGNAFARNDLSPGTHTITLTPTFDDGYMLSSSIVITVGVGGVPEISITSPQPGTIRRGIPIEFSGTANDPEDGELFGIQDIRWISDRDGEIGVGASFERSDLSAGDHTITMEAIDSDGNIARATTQITILTGIPRVTISDPLDGTAVEVGHLLSFVGIAVDPEDGILDDAALVWTSNIDGVICLDDEPGCVERLSTGIHAITLTATDSDGNVATAQITVTVFPLELSLTGKLQSHTGPFAWEPTISNPGPIELVTEVVGGVIFLTIKSDTDVRGQYDPETGDWTAMGETVYPDAGTLRETIEGKWESDENGSLVLRGTLTFNWFPRDGSAAGRAIYVVEYLPF